MTMLSWRNPRSRLHVCLLRDGYRLALIVLFAIFMPVHAETITIGKGVGKVWEGMPFSGTLSGNITNALLQEESIVTVSTSNAFCTVGTTVTKIAGYDGIQLVPGIILVPQMTVTGSFVRNNGTQYNFAGTIGIPDNSVILTNNGKQMRYNGNVPPSPWCFHPEANYVQIPGYFQANSPRQINYQGNWVLLADGSQTSADNITIPPIYISSAPATRLYSQIFPSSITLRVGTLACTAATTMNVDFRQVRRNTEAGTELSQYTAPLIVTCNQDAGTGINANINVQFRPISDHYEGTATRLALQQGGGYITGEINDGITSSGECTGSGGIPFDTTPVTLGNIGMSEYDKVFNQQIIWRLCSGGTSLPSGPVNAAAEMLVTYN